MEIKCDHRISLAHDKERAWCKQYALSIDSGSTICRQCQTAPSFKEQLEKLRRQRGDCKTVAEKADYCERYQMPVDMDICEACENDPALKQALFTIKTVTGKRQWDSCIHLGSFKRSYERGCCKGKKTRTVKVYQCLKTGNEAHEVKCYKCPSYEEKK